MGNSSRPVKVQPAPDPWRALWPGALLALLVVVAYLPALSGAFLWDDDSNIVKSTPLRSLAGLWQIWTQPGATQQYYPLTHSSFWLDYHVWGLNTTGYHVENVLLHALSTVLVWLLLRRLAVPGAWLGAALFGLHPVGVETVAWITERKNALSGPFFLGSVLMCVRFWGLDRPYLKGAVEKAPSGAEEPRGRWRYYWLALALYLCALLSKTATAPLPVVILVLIWWKRGRPGLRDLALLAPFFSLGAALGLVTMFLEKNHLGATGGGWAFSPLQRCLIASRAFWFYLGKLAWPHPLMFMYPRWEIRAANPLAYVPLVAAAVLFGALMRRSGGWARPVLAALGVFVAMLLPVLGFFNVVFYHYTFVCDHFQYLACIGPLALAAAGITLAVGRGGSWGPQLALRFAVPVAMVLTLGALTWRQTGVYQSLETLWLDALQHNPDSWMAHDNLGMWLSERQRFDDAASHYQAALALNPADYMAWNNLGLDSAQQGRLDEAIEDYTHALSLFPQYALGHYNLGNALARKGNLDEALEHYRRALVLDPRLAGACYSMGNALAAQGRIGDAMQSYTNALAIEPYFTPAHTALGRLLAAHGNLDGAIDHYRQALEIDPDSVDALVNLGNALVAAKKYDEAVASYQAALRIMPGSALIHYNLGVALTRMGRVDEGQQELAQAQQLKAAQGAGPTGPTGDAR